MRISVKEMLAAAMVNSREAAYWSRSLTTRSGDDTDCDRGSARNGGAKEGED